METGLGEDVCKLTYDRKGVKTMQWGYDDGREKTYYMWMTIINDIFTYS